MDVGIDKRTNHMAHGRRVKNSEEGDLGPERIPQAS